MDTVLSWALRVFCVLAALGPGFHVLRLLRLRAFARTFTEYGKLPEVQVPLVDFITLALSVIVIIAAVLEFRFNLAAPLALVATSLLWVYYLPGIYDAITGATWFTDVLGRTTSFTWQMLVYQIAAIIVASLLTYSRFRSQSLFNVH